MKPWKWLTRSWKVLKAVAILITMAGDATEDENITQEEEFRLWKQMWVVINTYRGNQIPEQGSWTSLP